MTESLLDLPTIYSPADFIRRRNIVGCGVHFGDNDVWIIGELKSGRVILSFWTSTNIQEKTFNSETKLVQERKFNPIPFSH